MPLLALTFVGQIWGQTACDLDNNGTTNVVDVTRAVSMALGTLPCTANVEATQTCSVITVQRIVNAALGQPCVTFNAATGTYNVTLSWLPTISAGAVGYNIYRRTTPTGTATKINTSVIAGTTFTDTQVSLGQTYYYSASAVDSAGNESGQSNQASATIPAT
jgi:fibronectin type 3 domain-containing protein